MAQSGFTPISIYYSTTASAVPTAANLVQGELAINTADGKLYYEDSSGVVQVLATKSTGSIGGSNTQVQFNNSGSLGGSSNFVWDNTNARLGIGISSPTSKLHVAVVGGGVIAQFAHTGETNNPYAYFKTNEAGNIASLGSFSSGSNSALGFLTADTERMRITSTGSVGIGTSSPATKLNIENAGECQLQMAYSSTIFGRIGRLSSGNYEFSSYENGGSLTFGTTTSNGSTTERMRIDSSGIVTMNAYGAGAATFSASGVISSVSDETWKTKDGVPTNTDAMLQKLEPGYWFYNEEKAPTFGQERQLGFYAQNVHEAIGEEAAPTPQEGKPWGYHDRSVLAVAVMSLKNALNTIEELKQRITVLENK